MPNRRSLLEPFHTLIDNNDFWNHNLDGLAAFAAKDYFGLSPAT